MIQTLFLPEKIDTYYLFNKKIVGIHIAQDKIFATVLAAKARSLTIIDTFSVDIVSEKNVAQEKIAQGLEKVMVRIGSYDQLNVSFSSAYVMFKEQFFPFFEKEKISLVLPFEIEPFLPFPLSEALFDFCITKKNIEKKGSNVIIAATQKKYFSDFMSAFTKAGLHPWAVTVDMLNVYGLYRLTHYFTQENHIVVGFDGQNVNVVYMQEGSLKSIRTLTYALAKEDKFWQDLFFTLQSFFQEYGQPQKVVFITDDVSIVQKAQKTITVPCEQCIIAACFPELHIDVASGVAFEAAMIFSLAAAYPSLFTTDFSLATDAVREKEKVVFKKEALVALCLTVVVLCAMLTHTILQVHKLSSAIEKTKMSVLKDLRKAFPGIKSNNVTEGLKNAKKSVTKEEEIWFSFSNQTRRSFLKYLYNLSTTIEREEIGLQLKKMVMNKDVILMEGSVRNFEGLAQFEQELKSTELFMHVPDFQKTEFSESLTIKAQREAA